ncbi:hypothetical protein P43SY_007391 [Pythium insidiosum]|uniref:MSP domain-containing protein n=1 Tax=Pythium insidiosum TaxID=114742 RepID=A0AAD5Q386_PYTIN|nr:hypothetical protein P43SY_007391 [Pythium insidiosum]
MISAAVGVNSSLMLEPAQTLAFPLEETVQGVRTCVMLTNISTRKHVVFKVRTTNADMFTVKPAQGVIAPGADVAVVITMVPTSCSRLLALPPMARRLIIERFLIQSVDRAEDMRGFNVDDLTEFWKRIPRELIMNKKLTCRFVDANAEDGALPRMPPIDRLQLDDAKQQEQLLARDVPSPPAKIKPRVAAAQRAVAPEQASPPQPLKKASNQPRSPAPQQMNNQLPSPPARAVGPRGNDLTMDDLEGSALYVSATPTPPIAPVTRQSQEDRQQQPLQNPRTSAISPREPRRQVQDHQPQHQQKPEGFEFESARDIDPQQFATMNSVNGSFFDAIGPDETAMEIREFRVHPAEYLTFAVAQTVSGRMDGSSYFFLTNKAHSSGLTFKVKTTNRTGYFVKPARGLIPPNSAQRIDVMLNHPEGEPFDSQQRELKDRFLIEVLFMEKKQFDDVMTMDDEVRRDQVLRLWRFADPSDRRQVMLNCQILEDRPVGADKSAQEARILLQKSQAHMATAAMARPNASSFNNRENVPLSPAPQQPWPAADNSVAQRQRPRSRPDAPRDRPPQKSAVEQYYS